MLQTNLNVGTLVNVDADPITTANRMGTFRVGDKTIHARPLNSEDYWLLKANFVDWTTLELSDLLKENKIKAFVFIVWLGTRRDSITLRNFNVVNSIVCEPYERWMQVLDHITSVAFVTDDSAFFGKTKEPENLLLQLKNMQT